MSTPVEAYPSCRFYVLIDELPQAVFTEVSGLQIDTELLPYAEGGNNGMVHRLPVRSSFSNLTLRRGLVGGNELLRWQLAIVAGKDDRRNLSVVQYDVAGNEVVRWHFINAFPVRWVGPQLQADGTRAAVETLELAYDEMKLG
jgi:phage tail-like protein